MASFTPKAIIEGSQLTTGAVTYYTAPANTRCIVKKAIVVNTTGTARTLTIYKVPSGGTAGATNTVTSGVTVAAGSTYEVFELEGHVLETGDFIQALSDAGSALTFIASGLEVPV